MNLLLSRTFGGLSKQYYFRQFLFGAIFLALIIFMSVSASSRGVSLNYTLLCLAVVNTLLYPYARFVYESVVGFVMGNNVLFVNALLVLVVKLITMVLCWSFAIVIAPIGLAYLYFYHSREAKRGA